MTVGERIRHLRKQVLKMTQEDFARKINISRSNIANIEIGKIALTDRVATDICNSFSISEEWLRTGEGEMHRETESTLFSAFARQYDLSDKERQAARYLLSLSSEDRQQILRVVEGLARAMQDDDAKKAEIEKRDQAHRMLDAELDAEQKGQSAFGSGSSAAKMA